MNIRRTAGFIQKATEWTQERQSWRRVCVTSQGEKATSFPGEEFRRKHLVPHSHLFKLHLVFLTAAL